MVLLWAFYGSLVALGGVVALIDDESTVFWVLMAWSVTWLAIVSCREGEKEVDPDEWWRRQMLATLDREEVRRSERIKNKKIA